MTFGKTDWTMMIGGPEYAPIIKIDLASNSVMFIS